MQSVRYELGFHACTVAMQSIKAFSYTIHEYRIQQLPASVFFSAAAAYQNNILSTAHVDNMQITTGRLGDC